MSTAGEGKQESGFPYDPEQTRTDLELTRAELGETVRELEDRLTSPARAMGRADHAARAMRERVPPRLVNSTRDAVIVARETPKPIMAVGAMLTGFVVVAWILRSRRKTTD